MIWMRFDDGLRDGADDDLGDGSNDGLDELPIIWIIIELIY